MLRYAADRITVAVHLAATAVLIVQWLLIERASAWMALSVILALPVASSAHNHNHLPLWKARPLNALQDYWFTFFYGLPKLSWLVIHNQSHHGHGNRPEADCTSTHFGGDRTSLLGLGAYVWACTPGFYREHGRALAALYRKDRRQLAYQLSHILFLFGALGLALALDARKALYFILVPQLSGITAITVFNYCQHVRTDYGSKLNVARNFTSPILNAYLFNVGHHTIHHMKPTLHWSLVPEAQRRLTGVVDPRLFERSFWSYFLRVFVAGGVR